MLRDESVRVEATWCGVESEAGYGGQCDAVHRKLKRIVKARGSLDAQEAQALREAQRLRLWRHLGHASLIEYMELEMGYTPRAAVERLRVAKAIEELPVIAEALTLGDLSFSAAKELTRVATPETETQWVAAATECNVRQVEDLVSGRTRGDTPETPPEPTLRLTVMRYDVRQETLALEREVRRFLEKERGERLDDDAFLTAIFRRVLDATHVGRVDATHVGDSAASEETDSTAAEGTDPQEHTALQRDRAPYQVAVTVCRECKRGWQDGGGVTVEMSPPAIQTALCDAEMIGSLDGEHIERAKQAIPPAVRRKVKRRDHDRCRVPACRSAKNLDIHHIVPREKGGTHTIENLLTLCEGHHLAHHEGSLLITGPASKAHFTKRAHNSFKIVTRAVETTKALKAQGFDKLVVKAAMEKTRTHVGDADLTLEHWIEIARGYCQRRPAR